jgi:hypothetical protein
LHVVPIAAGAAFYFAVEKRPAGIAPIACSWSVDIVIAGSIPVARVRKIFPTVDDKTDFEGASDGGLPEKSKDATAAPPPIKLLYLVTQGSALPPPQPLG